MIMDFRILSLNDYNDYSRDFDLLKIEKDESFGWKEKYKFLAVCKGCWYSISPTVIKEDDYEEYILKMDEFCDVIMGEEEYGNIYPRGAESYEKEYGNIYPIWTDTYAKEYCLYPLIIHKKYFNEFYRVLYHMLNSCSSHTIIFLTRLEYYEIIEGVIPLKKFITMLEDRKVIAGMSYILTL